MDNYKVIVYIVKIDGARYKWINFVISISVLTSGLQEKDKKKKKKKEEEDRRKKKSTTAEEARAQQQPRSRGNNRVLGSSLLRTRLYPYLTSIYFSSSPFFFSARTLIHLLFLTHTFLFFHFTFSRASLIIGGVYIPLLRERCANHLRVVGAGKKERGREWVYNNEIMMVIWWRECGVFIIGYHCSNASFRGAQTASICMMLRFIICPFGLWPPKKPVAARARFRYCFTYYNLIACVFLSHSFYLFFAFLFLSRVQRAIFSPPFPLCRFLKFIFRARARAGIALTILGLMFMYIVVHVLL